MDENTQIGTHHGPSSKHLAGFASAPTFPSSSLQARTSSLLINAAAGTNDDFKQQLQENLTGTTTTATTASTREEMTKNTKQLDTTLPALVPVPSPPLHVEVNTSHPDSSIELLPFPAQSQQRPNAQQQQPPLLQHLMQTQTMDQTNNRHTQDQFLVPPPAHGSQAPPSIQLFPLHPAGIGRNRSHSNYHSSHNSSMLPNVVRASQNAQNNQQQNVSYSSEVPSLLYQSSIPPSFPSLAAPFNSHVAYSIHQPPLLPLLGGNPAQTMQGTGHHRAPTGENIVLNASQLHHIPSQHGADIGEGMTPIGDGGDFDVDNAYTDDHWNVSESGLGNGNGNGAGGAGSGEATKVRFHRNGVNPSPSFGLNTDRKHTNTPLHDPTLPYRPSTKLSDEHTSWTARLRDWFISLRFSFLAVLVLSITCTSVLSWWMTFTAAQHSIGLVTKDYSSVLIGQISTEFDHRFAAVEHFTYINMEYFRIGLLDDQNTTRLLNTFLAQVLELNIDTATGLSITTPSKAVYGYGWYSPEHQSPYLVTWGQTGGNFTESRVDMNGVIYQVDVNDPNYDQTTKEWYTIVNTTDPDSVAWTPLYLFYNNWFISTSRAIYGPRGNLIGVVTADMQLAFINAIAKKLAASSDVGTAFFILEANSGSILGASIDDFDIIDDSDPTNTKAKYLFNGPPLLQALHSFIVRSAGRADVEPRNLLYQNLPSLYGQLTVDGSDLLVTVEPFSHTAGVKSASGFGPPSPSSIANAEDPAHAINWLFIHVLDRSEVEKEISRSNTRVLVLVICICGAFLIGMSLLLWRSLRLIASLSDLLLSFARFEFRTYLEDGRLKGRSVFAELRFMQDAVMEMTKAFRRHLEGKSYRDAHGPRFIRAEDVKPAPPPPVQQQPQQQQPTTPVNKFPVAPISPMHASQRKSAGIDDGSRHIVAVGGAAALSPRGQLIHRGHPGGPVIVHTVPEPVIESEQSFIESGDAQNKRASFGTAGVFSQPDNYHQ